MKQVTVGKTWRIKQTLASNFNVYDPYRRWIAKFNWYNEAIEYVENRANKDDVIAYN